LGWLFVQKMTKLLANALSKTYDNRTLVKNFSIEISEGEIVALLGPNGAGKTTCFYMISGLIKPDSGSIFFDQQDITYLPMYRRAKLGIAYLPQESSIFRGLNVEDNILSILEMVTDDQIRQQEMLEELLAEFSLTHIRYASSVSLSGGERRRVEIARTLAINPKFILLDEPLAGIDPIAIADIRKLILHLKKRKIGILITDHNVFETLKIVERAYIIHQGEVIYQGSAKEIVKNKKVQEVYLGNFDE